MSDRAPTIFREYYTDAIVDEAVDAAKKDGIYRFTITTNKVNRNSRSINIEGLSTENYERNGVVLYGHDNFGLPIGRMVSLTKKVKSIDAALEFDVADEFAAKVKGKVDRGFMRAVSIGFLPLETRQLESETFGPWKDYEVTKADLLEISIVSIPANPNTLYKHSMDESSYLERLAIPTTDEYDERLERLNERIAKWEG